MANHDVTARKHTEAQLIDRAIKNAAFRAELGVELPDSMTVEVLQETPSTVYLVLPQANPGAAGELTDTELESVAGGWSGATQCGSCDQGAKQWC